MNLSNEFEYLMVEKAIETIKKYNIGTWHNINDVKRFFEALLDQFQNSYKENDVNSIKTILLNRIMDLRITLEVLKILPADVFMIDGVFLELEVRKNTRMYSYLEKTKKIKEELE